MHRLRSSGTLVSGNLEAVPRLKKKALNSWATMQDTYFSAKDIFERHRVVITVGTSIASVATAWVGYSLRLYHEKRVDQRLETIEKAMNNNYNLDHSEMRKIAGAGSISATTCFATAGTALIVGCGLGWRGGTWYANRKLRNEQMKMLGQIKPKGLQLLGRIKPSAPQFQFLRRQLRRPRMSPSAAKTPEKTIEDTPIAHSSGAYPS